MLADDDDYDDYDDYGDYDDDSYKDSALDDKRNMARPAPDGFDNAIKLYKEYQKESHDWHAAEAYVHLMSIYDNLYVSESQVYLNDKLYTDVEEFDHHYRRCNTFGIQFALEMAMRILVSDNGKDLRDAVNNTNVTILA